jgi:hypothetical protein
VRLRTWLTCALAIAPFVAAALGAQAPPTSTPAANATVDQLSWVAGAWTGTLGERTIEQHWSAPLAGSIIAMYRSIQANKPTIYELHAMEQEGDGVVLRIKHFAPGPGLVGQEAKDESQNNRLVKIEDRVAVFEGGAREIERPGWFAGPSARGKIECCPL